MLKLFYKKLGSTWACCKHFQYIVVESYNNNSTRYNRQNEMLHNAELFQVKSEI